MTPSQRIRTQLQRKGTMSKEHHNIDHSRKDFFKNAKEQAEKMMNNKYNHEKEEMMYEALKKGLKKKGKLTKEEQRKIKELEEKLRKKRREEHERQFHLRLKERSIKASKEIIKRQKLVDNLLKR